MHEFLKHYKYLIKNEIEFDAGDIFNTKKLNDTILNQKLEHRQHIKYFAQNLKIGIFITCSIIIVIAFLFVWMKN